MLFEIEKKSIQEIASIRNLAESTLYGHLEEAILNGLTVNFKRLHISLEDLAQFETKLREPPINSNISKLSIIKEQMPNLSWNDMKIMLALIKKKYGLCGVEAAADSDGLKQATISLAVPSTSNQGNYVNKEVKSEPVAQSSKSRELPGWLKRPPCNQDTKSNLDSTTNVDKDKPKKKPKFM